MRPSLRPARRVRRLVRVAAAVLALVPAVAGCSSAGSDSRQQLDQVTAPDWFTQPADQETSTGLTRTYVRLPRGAADVELAYSQALGRAGWRYHDQGGVCGRTDAPDGCWTVQNYRLAFRATGNDGRDTSTGPSSLTVVVSVRT